MVKNNSSDQQDNVNFVVHNIYVKDVSFEVPNAPHIFSQKWEPKLDFDIEMDHSDLPDNLYEVVLSVTVTVRAANDEVVFLAEVKQAGIFLLDGIKDKLQKDYILSTTSPNILFPYVREVVSSLVTKGGFPQLVLPPMNFDGMYQQHLEEQKQQHATMETADA